MPRSSSRVPSAAVGYHTGIRWPHQSCRLMGQSRPSSSQRTISFFHRAGWNVTSPAWMAASALSASGFIETYHCGESSGSMTAPERDETGVWTVYASVLASRPAASRS